MTGRMILRFDSAAAAAEKAALILSSIAAEAMHERSFVSVALSGGSSPIALYKELAFGAVGREFPWARARFFFSDERCVPPDHENSNFGSTARYLFAADQVKPLAVHRIKGELGAIEAAADYESLLLRELGNPPVFDVVLLGMGRDGHTASLFPGDAALSAAGFVAPVASPGTEPNHSRVTLTLKAINESRAVIFLVSGTGKEHALEKALKGEADRAALPARMVAPSGTLTWLIFP